MLRQERGSIVLPMLDVNNSMHSRGSSRARKLDSGSRRNINFSNLKEDAKSLSNNSKHKNLASYLFNNDRRYAASMNNKQANINPSNVMKLQNRVNLPKDQLQYMRKKKSRAKEHHFILQNSIITQIKSPTNAVVPYIEGETIRKARKKLTSQLMKRIDENLDNHHVTYQMLTSRLWCQTGTSIHSAPIPMIREEIRSFNTGQLLRMNGKPTFEP